MPVELQLEQHQSPRFRTVRVTSVQNVWLNIVSRKHFCTIRHKFFYNITAGHFNAKNFIADFYE